VQKPVLLVCQRFCSSASGWLTQMYLEDERWSLVVVLMVVVVDRFCSTAECVQFVR